MGRKQEKRLVGIITRSWAFATPTPVVENGEIVRYNLTIRADDYRAMMAIATASPYAFVMPVADRDELTRQFADKAKTASGGYDLSRWSMGELAAAHEDVKGLAELAEFDAAIETEIKARTVRQAVA